MIVCEVKGYSQMLILLFQNISLSCDLTMIFDTTKEISVQDP